MACKLTEAQIDAMANDDRLSQVARRLALEAGRDWSTLDGDQRDAWHERAIEDLRAGKITAPTPRMRRKTP